MAIRNLLHQGNIEDFQQWLEEKGFIEQETKGVYEVMRYKKDGRWVIIFSRDLAQEHLTVRDVDELLVKSFIEERKRRNFKHHEPQGIKLYNRAKIIIAENPYNVIKRSGALKRAFTKTQLVAMIMEIAKREE